MVIQVFILSRIWCLIRIWNQISKKNILIKRRETKKGQTEFDRVPTFFSTDLMKVILFLFDLMCIKNLKGDDN
jgi:hypothetical protein